MDFETEHSERYDEFASMADDGISMEVEATLSGDDYDVGFDADEEYRDAVQETDLDEEGSAVLGAAVGDLVFEAFGRMGVTPENYDERALYSQVLDETAPGAEANTSAFREGFQDFQAIKSGLGKVQIEGGTPEAALSEVMGDADKPMSATEVVEYVDHGEFEYDAVEHRSWVSDKLNNLSNRGELAKFRDGNAVKYTLDTGKAIRNSILGSELSAERKSELLDDRPSEEGIMQIADNSGMDTGHVRRHYRMQDWEIFNRENSLNQLH